MIEVRVDDGGLASAFKLTGRMLRNDTARMIARTGARVRTQVRAGASGRPGPRAPTGNYRRSISHTNGHDGAIPVSVISTNAPQAARLEYGFSGIDALGRSYNQPAYPHWRPAAEKAQEFLMAEADKLVADVISRLQGGNQ
ncbi:hypothetical protein [Cellulomonas taurus]|uniref:hypothetical protein n=1 Tax=Cellulomonas taurus TaxID=2729175 RepID=UPI00145C48D8|nr:hypothetical protein [Cellulomonas taurus]